MGRKYFTLPLGIADTSVEEFINSKDAREKEKETFIDHRPLNILLVDDYKTSRRIINAYLQKMPYIIDEAENGKIAVEKYKTGEYDLVLMDMQMPVMDGYEATRIIRAWEQGKKEQSTPVVALTAYAYKDDIQKSYNAGCNAHVTKPVNKKKLLKTIYELTSFGHSIAPEKNTVSSGRIHINVESHLQFLIPGFLEEMNLFCQDLKEAEIHRDFKLIKEISHKIKGAGGSYGFEAISLYGGNIEKAAINKNLDTIQKQLQKLSDYLINVEVSYD